MYTQNDSHNTKKATSYLPQQDDWAPRATPQNKDPIEPPTQTMGATTNREIKVLIRSMYDTACKSYYLNF